MSMSVISPQFQMTVKSVSDEAVCCMFDPIKQMAMQIRNGLKI